MRSTITVALGILVLGVGCHTTPPKATGSVQDEVRAVLDQQVRDWNDGNIERFMSGYAKSPNTRFASGGEIRVGWENVLARYQSRYTNRAAMGKLTFSDLDINAVAPDAAVAFGRWQLRREQDAPSGLFTLVFRRSGEGWRIVHDHTSSAGP